MKRLLLCSIFLVLSQFNFAQDITVLEPVTGSIVEYVDVAQPWSETAVAIESGKTYTIIVEGTTSTRGGSYKQHRYYTGPEGINSLSVNNPIPNEYSGSVIGKIGTDGVPFYVGRIFSFLSNKTGTLYLGYNDYQFGDNTGFFVAFIFSPDFFVAVDGMEIISTPTEFSLAQNFPNPFNPQTTIEYNVSKNSRVILKIFNNNGELVNSLIDEIKSPGNYSTIWYGSDNRGHKVSSGVYYYQLNIDGISQTKKMMLLK